MGYGLGARGYGLWARGLWAMGYGQKGYGQVGYGQRAEPAAITHKLSLSAERKAIACHPDKLCVCHSVLAHSP